MKNPIVRTIAFAGMLLLLAGGCTTAGPRWPAISETPTDVRIQGRWVWGELFADDVEAEKAFYGTVFGWQFSSHGTGTNVYTVVRVDGRPIAGIVHFAKPADAVRSARWLPLMSVPDAAQAAQQAVAGGGKVLVPSRALPGRGEVAVLADPEGAIFGVIRSASGDPADIFPSENAWIWLELWARDAAKMAEFYRPLGAYTVAKQEGPGDRPELHLMAGGFPRASVLEIERENVPSTWLPYVRVKDVHKAVAGIERAGGRIIVPPSPEVRNGKVAVFLDPLGAAVAVAEWKDEDEGEGKP
jgi:predicted enzyme related to lactoylglutathione lyase